MHISPLKQNIIKKKQVKKVIFELEFNKDKGKNHSKYKVKVICNNAIYTKESEEDQVSHSYQLIS